jgi:hypothetical protein
MGVRCLESILSRIRLLCISRRVSLLGCYAPTQINRVVNFWEMMFGYDAELTAVAEEYWAGHFARDLDPSSAYTHLPSLLMIADEVDGRFSRRAQMQASPVLCIILPHRHTLVWILAGFQMCLAFRLHYISREVRILPLMYAYRTLMK